MPGAVYLLGCRVLESALAPLLDGAGGMRSARFMDYGLHTIPERMTPQLQAELDALEPPGTVLLGYGLCGNGLVGLAAGRHTLVIPRVDDCIALLMGSYRAYIEDFRAHSGTYYLSKGWLESGYHPTGQAREWAEKYGEERAARAVRGMYKNYRRMALVALSPEEIRLYRPQAEESARFIGVEYDEITGSDGLLRRLVERAASPGQTDEEFVVIPPGGTVRQDMFIR